MIKFGFMAFLFLAVFVLFFLFKLSYVCTLTFDEDTASCQRPFASGGLIVDGFLMFLIRDLLSPYDEFPSLGALLISADYGIASCNQYCV